VKSQLAVRPYTPGFIERSNKASWQMRIYSHLVITTVPRQRRLYLPVSGNPYTFQGSDHWMHELAERLFAYAEAFEVSGL